MIKLKTIKYKTLQFTASADMLAGTIVKIEGIYGFLIADVKTGEEACLVYQADICEADKEEGTWETGKAVRLKVSDKTLEYATAKASTNVLLGFMLETCAGEKAYFSFDGTKGLT